MKILGWVIIALWFIIGLIVSEDFRHIVTTFGGSLLLATPIFIGIVLINIGSDEKDVKNNIENDIDQSQTN